MNRQNQHYIQKVWWSRYSPLIDKLLIGTSEKVISMESITVQIKRPIFLY